MYTEFEKIEHNRVNGLLFMINDLVYRRPHLHFDSEIVYVISGEGSISTSQTEFHISAGQMIFFNSCQLHEFRSNASSSSMRLLIMQLPMTDFASVYPALDSMLFESRPINLPFDSKLLSYLISAAQSYFDELDYQPLRTTGLAYLIVYELLQLVNFNQLDFSQQNKMLDLQKRIQRISAKIHENFVNGISLQELASQEGFSTTYFSHFFKNNFGISFQEYLNNVRCERGRLLLLTTNENLLSITNLCGFSDVRTFNKAFCLLYGHRPKDLLDERKKNSNKQLIDQKLIISSSSTDLQRIFNPTESLAVLKELLNSLNL
ncbi:MAG: AraC family transcriptional regulator [Streptococcaceae bacterium]|jgi:AraC-like DNA-binding protein|nr:AraC family transcriptional regulator [Streptococcaceae bacterium]